MSFPDINISTHHAKCKHYGTREMQRWFLWIAMSQNNLWIRWQQKGIKPSEFDCLSERDILFLELELQAGFRYEWPSLGGYYNKQIYRFCKVRFVGASSVDTTRFY